MLDSKLQTDKRGSVQDLSPKYLWKQIKLIDGYALDAGTDMRSIMKSLQNVGDCNESTLPDVLDATIEAYSDPSVLTDAMKHEAYQNDIGNYAFTDSPSWEQLKQAIYQNKVVIALVDIGDGWYTPSWAEKDILPLRLGNKVGGHFIVLYGWDEQYIYFRNSWGTSWGRNGDGYFDSSYLPYVREIGTALALPAPYIFTDNLSIFQTSNDVLQLQKRLNVQPQTGWFGPVTFTAVLRYQLAHNILATGFVGPLTRASLNTSS